MDKGGQIALFVIIAVLLIGAVIFAVYYNRTSTTPSKASTTPDLAKAVESHIDSCVDKSSRIALMGISRQGGYEHPANYLQDQIFAVGYWYDKGKDMSLTKEQIQFELSNSACILLKDCLEIKNYSQTFSIGNCSATASIMPNYTIINIDYPIRVDISQKAYMFEKFSKKFDVRLGTGITASKSIVLEQIKHPNMICATCMSDIAEESGMPVNVFSQNDSFIVQLVDPNSQVYANQTYEFRFAMRL